LISHLDRGQQLVFDKEPEDMVEQNGQTVDHINNSNNLRTNAIKVGTKQFNSRGWKPGFYQVLNLRSIRKISKIYFFSQS